jgi:hypothetical protein
MLVGDKTGDLPSSHGWRKSCQKRNGFGEKHQRTGRQWGFQRRMAHMKLDGLSGLKVRTQTPSGEVKTTPHRLDALNVQKVGGLGQKVSS